MSGTGITRSKRRRAQQNPEMMTEADAVCEDRQEYLDLERESEEQEQGDEFFLPVEREIAELSQKLAQEIESHVSSWGGGDAEIASEQEILRTLAAKRQDLGNFSAVDSGEAGVDHDSKFGATVASHDQLVTSYIHFVKLLNLGAYSWKDYLLKKGPIPPSLIKLGMYIHGIPEGTVLSHCSKNPNQPLVGLGHSMASVNRLRSACSYVNKLCGWSDAKCFSQTYEIETMRGMVQNTANHPLVKQAQDKVAKLSKHRAFSASAPTRSQVLEAFERMKVWKNQVFALQCQLLFLMCKDLMLRANEALEIRWEDIHMPKDTTTMYLASLPEDLKLCPVLKLRQLRQISRRSSGFLFRELHSYGGIDSQIEIQSCLPLTYASWCKTYKQMFQGILGDDGLKCSVHGPRMAGCRTWAKYYGVVAMRHFGRWKSTTLAVPYAHDKDRTSPGDGRGGPAKLCTETDLGERDYARPKFEIFTSLENHL